MIHHIFSFRFLFLSCFSLALLGVGGSIFWYPEAQNVADVLSPGVVLADDEDEDDEDEEESDENEDDENDDDEKEGTKISFQESVVTTYRTTYQLVEKTVTTLDEKFKIDTDGDLLVDGLDPHPTTPESAYFTDDDEDAVSNAWDAYPGKDDFFVFDDEADQDHDGLIDALLMETRE